MQWFRLDGRVSPGLHSPAIMRRQIQAMGEGAVIMILERVIIANGVACTARIERINRRLAGQVYDEYGDHVAVYPGQAVWMAASGQNSRV